MATRTDIKRRADVNYKKKQFAQPSFKQQEYKQRLNFYSLPPTAEITLEDFEEWAINRLKGMQGVGIKRAEETNTLSPC